MTTEIQIVPGGSNPLSLLEPPETVIAQARKAAMALQEIIKGKKNPVVFAGEQYVEREDWGMIAKFYGCTAKIVSTNYVEYGNAQGWEATAVCLDRNGNVISQAESMCLNDEDNWGMRPEYKWEDELDENGKKIWVAPANGKKGYYKGKKVQTGEKPTPQFQLRSMAQTRAEAKVLKSVFGAVVVLAGYKPSVAEEMVPSQQPEGKPEKEDGRGEPPPVQRKSEKAKAEGGDMPIATKPGCITEKQIKMLFAIQRSAQINDETIKALLKGMLNIEHRNEIPFAKFQDVLNAIDPDHKFHTPLAQE